MIKYYIQFQYKCICKQKKQNLKTKSLQYMSQKKKKKIKLSNNWKFLFKNFLKNILRLDFLRLNSSQIRSQTRRAHFIRVNGGIEYKKSFKFIRNIIFYKIKYENTFAHFQKDKKTGTFKNFSLKIICNMVIEIRERKNSNAAFFKFY